MGWKHGKELRAGSQQGQGDRLMHTCWAPSASGALTRILVSHLSVLCRRQENSQTRVMVTHWAWCSVEFCVCAGYLKVSVDSLVPE